MELKLLDLIQTLRTPAGDVLMPLISSLGNHGEIWIALCILLLLFPKTRKAGIAAAIALVLDALLCDCFLKPLAARVRPFDVNTAVRLLIAAPRDYSFPSGHTAAAFAVSFSLLFSCGKKAGIPALLFSALMAFTRLYLYVHYPTDVLGGFLLGLFCGAAGWKAGKWIGERGKGKEVP